MVNGAYPRANIEQCELLHARSLRGTPQFVDEHLRGLVRTPTPETLQLLATRLVIELLSDSTTLLAGHGYSRARRGRGAP
jgi:hypothetical protein